MLGDPVKRLKFIVQQIDPNSLDQRRAALGTLIAWLRAVNLDDIAAEYTAIHPFDVSLNTAIAEIREFAQPELKDTPFDKFLPWIYRALLEEPQNAVEIMALLPDLPDWQRATKADIGRFSFVDALVAIAEWREADAAKRVAYRFDNGWSVLRLWRRKELEDEGAQMNHCVSGARYYKPVRAGETVIYSLRNPRGEPRVTMEWLPRKNRFKQMMMRDDKYPPSEEYRPMLMEFVTKVHGGNILDLLLTGVKARDLDLRGANLSSADLIGADLTGANLTDAVLFGADLTNADLTGADLTGANLTDAVLFGADLINADLTGADLTNADLTGADLTGADLTNARFDLKTIMPDGIRWSPPAGLGYYRRRR